MARIAVALTLGSLALLVAVLQIGGLIAARRGGRSYSFVPFLGAALGVSACLIAPWSMSVFVIPAFLVLDPTPVTFAVTLFSGRMFK